MARRRAAVAAECSKRVRSGARLSHQASYRSVIASRSLALTVGVSPRTMAADGHLADAQGAGDAGGAVAHDVQGAQPQPGAAGVDAGAAQGAAGDVGQGSGGGGGGLAAAGAQAVDGCGRQSGGCGDGPVAAAVVLEAAYLIADVAGNRPGSLEAAAAWPRG